MAEKRRKSKDQQRGDMAKLAAGAAAAGYVATRVARRGKKSKLVAALIALVVALVIFGVGAMYYFDIKPFDADFFNGKFKCWYMSADSFVASDGDLQVRFLDIGQGDCALVQLPDGKNMLIDSGKNNSETEKKIIDTLKEVGATTIDYGVLTHTDSDHSGGMDKVIASDDITFKTMYMPLVKSKLAGDKVQAWYDEAKDGYLKDLDMTEPADFNIQTITTQVYADFMQALLNEEGCEPIFSFAGMQIKGDGYVFDFYNPTYQEYKEISTAKQKNNVSPVMILRFNGKKILFTGDCDSAESNFNSAALAATDPSLFDVDVLKVAHHGGKESTSENFLKIVQPEYSVISVGENSYNHPTQEVLKRLSNVGSKIFTTQDKGDIIMTVKGTNIGWCFEKDGSSYGSASEYDAEDIAASALSFACMAGRYGLI